MRARIPIGSAGFVGASLTAEALGLSTFGTPYDAWLKFMGKAPEPDEETKERFEMGHQLEDFIAKQIERVYGVKTRRCNDAYVHPEHPWLICHIDRMAIDKDGNKFPIEIKSASSFSARKWGSEGTDEIPYSYRVQCEQYFICGVPNSGYMWQITFADNKLTRYIIKRDEELESLILARIVDLVENHWLRGEVPAPSSYREASQIWEGDTAGAIEADAATLSAVKELDEIAESKRSLLEREDHLKAQIVEYMQGKEKLMYMGEKLMTYKRIEQSRFDTKSFRKDHPELADAYTVKSGYMKLA